MLKADDVETAFVETAHQQEGGAFNWQRLTQLLNERLADDRDRALGERPALFTGGNRSPSDMGLV